jgi:hypothetical protein
MRTPALRGRFCPRPRRDQVDLDFAIVPRRWVPTSTIEAEVRKRLQAYFNPQGDPAYLWIESLGVGEKVVFNQLVEIVMSVDGVYDVRFVSPVWTSTLTLTNCRRSAPSRSASKEPWHE